MSVQVDVIFACMCLAQGPGCGLKSLMGVLDDTILSIDALDKESIAFETPNCCPVSTESKSDGNHYCKRCQEVCTGKCDAVMTAQRTVICSP